MFVHILGVNVPKSAFAHWILLLSIPILTTLVHYFLALWLLGCFCLLCFANLVEEMQDQLKDIDWQRRRDDKFWAWKFLWAQKLGVQKFKCPCNLYLGRSKPRLVGIVHEHLIKFGWLPQYWVWKGSGPTNDSNEEWVAHARKHTKSTTVQLDEGVHMETMLEHLV
jgi:hypothetical protein